MEEENSTIKNIHQGTMKKLARLEEGIEGERVQEERRKLIRKNELLSDEMRNLNEELMERTEN